MKLIQLKHLIDELCETNNYGYTDFDVQISLCTTDDDAKKVDIHLKEKVIVVE